MPADTHDAAGPGAAGSGRERTCSQGQLMPMMLLVACQTLVAEVLMLLRVVMPARPANAVLAVGLPASGACG